MHTATAQEKKMAIILIVIAAILLFLGAGLFAAIALLVSIGFGIYGMVRPFKPGPYNPFDLQAKIGAIGAIMFVLGWVFDLIF